jgi:hypothetical protein
MSYVRVAYFNCGFTLCDRSPKQPGAVGDSVEKKKKKEKTERRIGKKKPTRQSR